MGLVNLSVVCSGFRLALVGLVLCVFGIGCFFVWVMFWLVVFGVFAEFVSRYRF